MIMLYKGRKPCYLPPYSYRIELAGLIFVMR